MKKAQNVNKRIFFSFKSNIPLTFQKSFCELKTIVGQCTGPPTFSPLADPQRDQPRLLHLHPVRRHRLHPRLHGVLLGSLERSPRPELVLQRGDLPVEGPAVQGRAVVRSLIVILMFPAY